LARACIGRLATIELLVSHGDNGSLREARGQAEVVLEGLGYQGQLHTGDETETLFPQLVTLLGPGDREVDEALHRLDEEHAALVPLWPALEWWLRMLTLGERLVGLDDLHEARTALTVRYLPHLDLEERVVFPAARWLVPPALARSLVLEMRERRRTCLRLQATALP
jgi:hypothetical protein